MGDWMPLEGWDAGISRPWKRRRKVFGAIPPMILEPELYSYAFLVDGLRVNDPNNAFLSRDISSNTNIFIIDGPSADLYKVNDVPHGTVSRRWYDSPGP